VTDFDERLGMGIKYDEDTNMWSLVDAEGQEVGGPYVDKQAAQQALRRRAHYIDIGKRRKGAGQNMKQRTSNPAWEKLEKLVDDDVGEGANQETRAGSMSKILKTARGKELYAKGAESRVGFTPGEDEDDETDETETDDVEKREPVRRADAVWERIKTRAEVIQKKDLRGRVSFAKAVDQVLRDNPALYARYRRALLQR
jgi:hypothetical protein